MVPGDVKFPADKLSALTSFKKLPDEEVRALVTKSAKNCSASDAECFSAMENCIRAVRAWMIQDKMKLNDDKTEAFAVAAPWLFNSLPREIRHETCFNTFKT
ncbi:unnamed protein product, partial [Porites lobata]